MTTMTAMTRTGRVVGVGTIATMMTGTTVGAVEGEVTAGTNEGQHHVRRPAPMSS
ncbi:MAG: hypothetical protein AB7R89_06585 [Dehalococcoidia bacterium]